jgi:hypothetical protein
MERLHNELTTFCKLTSVTDKRTGIPLITIAYLDRGGGGDIYIYLHGCVNKYRIGLGFFDVGIDIIGGDIVECRLVAECEHIIKGQRRPPSSQSYIEKFRVVRFLLSNFEGKLTQVGKKACDPSN